MLELLKRLTRNTVIYGLGNILQRGAAFLLVPLYTRFLSPADYGIVAVVNSIVQVLSIVYEMGQAGAVNRFYFEYADKRDELRNYLGTVFTFSLISTGFITALLLVFGKSIFSLILKDIPFDPYIKLALWIPFFSIPLSILLGLYRAREQAVLYAFIQLSKFLVTTALIVFFVVFLRQGALGKIRGQMFGCLIFFILSLALALREAAPSFSASKLKKSLSFGFPLVPHLLGAWILALADRFILQMFVPLSVVGLYNVGYQLGTVPSMVVSTISLAWVPLFYREAKKGGHAQQRLGKVSTLIALVIIFAGLLLIVFSKEIILLMTSKEFYAAAVVVPPVALGCILDGLYVVAVTPVFYMAKTKMLPLFTGIAASINIGLNFLLIPKLGMMGAAYATLIAFALRLVLVVIYAQRAYPIPYEFHKIGKVLVMLGGAYLANEFLAFDSGALSIAVKIALLLTFIGGLLIFRVVRVSELMKGWKLLHGKE